MAKALQINRIDMIVHPFYRTPILKPSKPAYTRVQGKKLLEVWKKHVDEVASHPDRLLLISPPNLYGTKWQNELKKELFDYAKKQLGERIGFFFGIGKAKPIFDHKMRKFKTFDGFAAKNGFKVNPDKVKTRSLGEYTHSCVVDYLIGLNKFVGLKKVIPYRNEQSTIIARKSIGAHLKGWEVPELMKTAKGRAKLRRKAKKYIKLRGLKANLAADVERKYAGLKFEGKNLFKPRPHLMKKKKHKP